MLTSKGRKFYKNCEYVHKVAEDIIAKRKKAMVSPIAVQLNYAHIKPSQFSLWYFIPLEYSQKQEKIWLNSKLQEKEGPRKTRHLDFLDILLTARDEDGNGLTLTEIRNEVDTFMFAGKEFEM